MTWVVQELWSPFYKCGNKVSEGYFPFAFTGNIGARSHESKSRALSITAHFVQYPNFIHAESVAHGGEWCIQRHRDYRVCGRERNRTWVPVHCTAPNLAPWQPLFSQWPHQHPFWSPLPKESQESCLSSSFGFTGQQHPNEEGKALFLSYSMIFQD